MKKITILIVLMLLSLVSFTQNLGQQQKEIENIIRPEIEARLKTLKAQQNQTQTNQNQTQPNQNQIQLRHNQTQTTQQQAIENYTNKMSIEGQIRMEQINNPDTYIDRGVTNRGSSAVFPDDRNYQQNQPRDLRTEPIHSESLTSKSLQMLREANREYFSNEDREVMINPNAYVQLFDAPSLGEYQPLEVKHDNMYRSRQIMNRIAREKAEREKLENEVAVRNDIIDLMKNGINLVGSVIIDDATVSSVKMAGVELGKGAAGFLLSENINLFSEMAKYWNECSAGTKQTMKDFNFVERFLKIDKMSPELIDSYEMIKNATVNSAIGKIATVIGDKAGVAYVGMEKMGTGAYEMYTSLKIGLSLSNFAVNNEKQED